MKTEVAAINALEVEFYEALRDGLNGLQRAGQILVKILDADPQRRDVLLKKYGLQHAVLNTLEKIGRGVWLPKIALAGGRLLRLTPGDQRRATEGAVDALVLKDGGGDVLKVDLLCAPKEMLDQLLNGDHIRTLDEQRAYLATKSNAAAAQLGRESAEGMPWKVSGKMIDIVRPIRGVTRGMLLTMLKALEG